jgi:predicted small secreted protein
MPIRRTVMVFAILVGLALFLAACGGGGHGGY